MGERTLPQPPKTDERPVTETIHGGLVTDAYRWLERPDSAATLAWIDAQNRYADAVLGARPEVRAMREALRPVLAEAVQYSGPACGGHDVYVRRRGGGEDVAVLVRIGPSGGAPTVLYDPSREPRQPTAIDWYQPSPGGRYVALGASVDGTEDSTLCVIEAATGRILPERIPHSRFSSVAWLSDESAFCYTRHPAPGEVPAGEEFYHQTVRLHALGADPADDPVLFGPGRPLRESHHLVLSDDDRYLYLFSGDGWRRVTVRRLDLASPGSAAATVLDGYDATFDGVEHAGRLILRTNVGASRYRIVEVDPDRPEEDAWRDVVPASDLVVRGFALQGDRLVVHALKDVSAVAFVADRTTGGRTDVAIPAHGTVSALVRGPGDDALLLFESFTQAPTLYRVDASTGALGEVVASTTSELAQGLTVRQVFYASYDGTTRCPMYIVERADAAAGVRPTVLSGYGGFNLIRSSRYTPDILPWVHAGGVFAQANMRGGGEYGEEWHRMGMEDLRQQSFDDFMAAGDYLIAQGITDSAHLGVEGRSLGGLLTAVVLTQRPDLARAVVSGVPLLDMLRYHLFLIGALWIVEYGSPEVPEQYAWLRAYSPYHNVRDGVRYPATYLFAAMDDGRVDAAHARKMAALLQRVGESVPDPAPVVLRTLFHAGHGAGKPLTALLDEQAETWGFLAWQLGLNLA